MQVNKAYKVQLYPNKEQEVKLFRVVGACRYVWNYYLDKRKTAYLDGKKISYAEMAKDLTKLRHTTDWMAEIQAEPLQQSLRKLDTAYNRFFRKITKYPNFKSKKDIKQGFQKHQDFRIVGNKVIIQKDIVVKCRGTLPPKDIKKLGTMAVSYTAGKWYASFQVVEEIKPKKLTSPIGIDLGLTSLIITSNGQKIEHPKFYISQQRKLKKLQQNLSRKIKGSNRRGKAKVALSRFHDKVQNQRKDYLHNATHRIVRAKPKLIACEDLSVKGMLANHCLAKSISDASWGEILRQLEYKQKWNGGEFVKIGRFFPSSKTCSACHFIKNKLPLSYRKWTCPKCKTKHDRDINAAKVILEEGLAYSHRRG